MQKQHSFDPEVCPLTYQNKILELIHPRIEICPFNDCGAYKRLHKHGYYSRFLLWRGKVLVLRILRHFCTQCKRTVSILPDFAHPIFQHSLESILSLIKNHALGTPPDGELFSYYKLQLFFFNRFLRNAPAIISYLRQLLNPYLSFPETPKEKAIELLTLIANPRPSFFAINYFSSHKKGFMAL